MMKKSLLVVFLALVSLALAQDESRLSRMYKERVRSQDPVEVPTASSEEHSDDERVDEKPASKTTFTTITSMDRVRNSDDDKVLGSMDTLASLARVQRDQAETFRMWSSQFQVFKTTVMKFMETTSEVLQKNVKKINTLQRVVKKIATDIDE